MRAGEGTRAGEGILAGDGTGPAKGTGAGVRNRRLPGLARAVVLALVVIVGLLGVIRGLQRSLIYFPDTAPPAAAEQILPGAQEVTHRTEDGFDLHAWYLPARAQSGQELAVLVLPGNGGNREGRAPLAAELHERGFAVMLIDYRGYGGNPGSPSEEGLAMDARSAQEPLTDLGYPPSRTIYVGESLGTGVAARLQASTDPAGLVLRSPMTNLADVGRAHYPFLPVRTLLKEEYDVLAGLQAGSAPVAVMYSQADEVIPPELSAQVARADRVTHTVVLPTAGHNDAVMIGPVLADLVAELAEHIRTAG